MTSISEELKVKVFCLMNTFYLELRSPVALLRFSFTNAVFIFSEYIIFKTLRLMTQRQLTVALIPQNINYIHVIHLHQHKLVNMHEY